MEFTIGSRIFEEENDQAVVAETDASQQLPLEILMCGTRSVN